MITTLKAIANFKTTKSEVSESSGGSKFWTEEGFFDDCAFEENKFYDFQQYSSREIVVYGPNGEDFNFDLIIDKNLLRRLFEFKKDKIRIYLERN